MTQPTPAPPAPGPIAQTAWYFDIENIYWQIMGEQPETASSLAIEWIRFAIRLATASEAMKNVKNSLSGWESPEAKEAYNSRSEEATEYLDDVADTALTVGLRLGDVSDVMADGQERIQGLYNEYQAAITKFDNEDARGQYRMRMDLEMDTGVVYIADGTNRGRFKAHYDQRAMDMSDEIGNTYVEPVMALEAARFPYGEPHDYVYHPGGMGMPFLPPGGPGGAPPPPVTANAPPPTPATTLAAETATPPPAATLQNAPPPQTAVSGQPVPVVPPPATATPVPPPGTTAPADAPPAPPAPVPAPAALPPGAVITPPGLVAPPGSIVSPSGSVVGPPGAARLTGPAGAQLPPGARTLGIESLPPSVLGADSVPPNPGVVTPTGPPDVNAADPGSPGTGMGMPPGMGGMGMPPGMGMGAPPPPAGAAQRGNRNAPPGPGASQPGSPEFASGNRSSLQMPPGAGMGMPPGTGMMPPGTGAGGPPAGQPGARDGRATTPPGGATPGIDVPEAFLPPSGFGPPVLGDPQQRQQRTRPGGMGEAPLAFRPVSRGPRIGGGTPPILTNPHHTGPRPTHTQRRTAERLAHRERMKQFREVVKASAFARDLPEGIAPVLEGRPATDGAAGAAIAEIPPALRALRQAVERSRRRRAAQPADQAARRPIAEPAGTPASQPGATWEVETPGGPVVSGEQRRGRPPDRSPRTLGGGS